MLDDGEEVVGGQDMLAEAIENALEADTVRAEYLATGLDDMKRWLEACVTRW